MKKKKGCILLCYLWVNLWPIDLVTLIYDKIGMIHGTLVSINNFCFKKLKIFELIDVNTIRLKYWFLSLATCNFYNFCIFVKGKHQSIFQTTKKVHHLNDLFSRFSWLLSLELLLLPLRLRFLSLSFLGVLVDLDKLDKSELFSKLAQAWLVWLSRIKVICCWQELEEEDDRVCCGGGEFLVIWLKSG